MQVSRPVVTWLSTVRRSAEALNSKAGKAITYIKVVRRSRRLLLTYICQWRSDLMTRSTPTTKTFWPKRENDCVKLTLLRSLNTLKPASRFSWTWRWRSNKKCERWQKVAASVARKNPNQKRKTLRKVIMKEMPTWQRLIMPILILSRLLVDLAPPVNMNRCCKGTRLKYVTTLRLNSNWSCISSACKISLRTKKSSSRKK